jgi:hypothetical protein
MFISFVVYSMYLSITVVQYSVSNKRFILTRIPIAKALDQVDLILSESKGHAK